MEQIKELLERIEPTDRSQISELLKLHTEDIEMPQEYFDLLLDEAFLTLFDTMDRVQLLDTLMYVAVQNIQVDPLFEDIAVRFLLTKCYLSAVMHDDGEDFGLAYRESFVSYIKWGVEEKLLNPDMEKKFDLYKLALRLRPERDRDFTYIGLQTALNRYAVKARESHVSRETPQYLWMRVAMGMALKEKDPTDWALKFYDKLSLKEYTAGGSTMIGAGTVLPTLANCFILDTQDTIESIFENVSNIAYISKGTGGIGLAVTKLRGEGSPIKTNNTFSSGPIPFIKVMDMTLAAVSRAGKKMGAMAIYMENWHINFPQFLELRNNAGDEHRRTRTANTAVYISDEFMKRVESGADWYLFDPAETPELTELYGAEFSKKYKEYVDKAEKGELRMWDKVPAREQFKNIVTQLQSTAHPWITFKDTINLRALNNNTGTIHSSNLCTEVCLPQDEKNIAVCNLLYVNLTKHMMSDAIEWGGNLNENLKGGIDWDRLEDSVRKGIRHLDNLPDVGISPVKEARNSDVNNRAVGLGIMGLSECLEILGYAYDSEDAYDFADRVIEFISYISIDESCNLAEERGSYNNFEGSMWSKGFVPYDTMEVLEKDRGIELAQNREYTMDWDLLRERVKKGIRNATVMMIAPNGNSSLTAGTSPGIDPRFALIFSRTTVNGKFLDINRNLVSRLKEHGVWEEVREELIRKQGDISEIEQIPDDIKRVFKTSFQISPFAYIEIASRCQKWIDQSMSRNIYSADREVDNLMEVYYEGWRRGVKTTYYLHMKPRNNVEQSTVKVNKAKDLKSKGFGALRSIERVEEEVEAITQNAEVQIERESEQVEEVVATDANAQKKESTDQKTKKKLPAVSKPRGFAAVKSSESTKASAAEKNEEDESTVQLKGFAKVASASVDTELNDSTNESDSSNKSSATSRKKASDNTDTTSEKTKELPKISINKFTGKACPIDPAERALCDGCE